MVWQGSACPELAGYCYCWGNEQPCSALGLRLCVSAMNDECVGLAGPWLIVITGCVV